MPPYIGLIVTGQDALYDFKIFLKTLELYHPNAVLYVATDSTTDIKSIPHKCTIHTRVTLDEYRDKRRPEMEATQGKRYDSLFKDYTYEKATILEHMFEVEEVKTQGAWFMDADIVHCAPLPTIPETATLALSPHYIRLRDEERYGRYNAGYFWMKDPSYLAVWREAGHTSTFFEQKALETVAKTANENLYEFSDAVNFGWWRMYQNSLTPAEVQMLFRVHRNEPGIGLRYNGKTLQSLHTHSGEMTYTTSNGMFNLWIRKCIEKLVQAHKPAAQWNHIVFS